MNLIFKNKTRAKWWEKEEAHEYLVKAKELYNQIGKQKSCDFITHFLLQFDALNYLLKAYNRANYRDQLDQYICICYLLEREMGIRQQSQLLQTVNDIGIELLNKAFRTINQECEDPYQEKPDIFFFIKKHRLNLPKNCTDEEIFKYLSYYLNVTLINYNRIKNLNLQVDSDKLLAEKSEASKTVIPVVEKIFELILDSHSR